MRRAACLVVLAMLALPGCSSEPRYSGWQLDPVYSAPDLLLPVAGGDSLSFARPGGRLSLVTFGYTTCPDVCPATMSDWRKIRPRLGADTSRVRFVFVSVDWKHDSPQTAAEFAHRFHPSFQGVLADSAAWRRLLPAFRADAKYDSIGADQTAISHTDYSYVVDDSARVTLSFDFAAPPEKIAHDLRAMIRARHLAER